ncbi:Rpn family recombination-promoting nuclease/putative transposase [Pedobacter nutrimenti]|uniref:Rpn family recombination-promoting nuclease/putative transposase n=1 Tax=Pedobacter nutrimenti TaxID=1241337 RepID=UPI00292D45EF|nr:Rpn family recombination-promoting nuclease/putative transposase [Pedobacter nutrimenti]
MQKKTNLAKPVKPIELSSSRYINVKTDFSFKYIFGSESRKKLLIDFLNAVFKGRKVIRDLTFNNPSHKGMRKENRKTVFDVYCTDNKGGKFIVEIQQVSQRFFKDRILYYSANLIREQGKSVAPDWNYRLPEVYVVALMDFSFDHTHRDQYLHDVRLMDVMTHTVFYDKLRYIFVELPKFKKSVDELKTNEDGWLYSLRNMEILDEIPVPLRKKKVFRELYQLAEVINLSPEDMNAYQESLKIKRDNYSALESAELRGEQRGQKQGIEIGVELGRAKAEQEKREMAIEMLAGGEPLEKIARYSKLSITEIQALV